MPYYHVLVTSTAKEAENICVASDLTEAQLKKLILRPYRAGHTLAIEGRLYPPTEIREICIVKTKVEAELTLDAAAYDTRHQTVSMNANLPRGPAIGTFAGYGIEQIKEFGDVVTPQYINGPPGKEGIFDSLISISKKILVVVAVPWGLAAFQDEIKVLLTTFWLR